MKTIDIAAETKRMIATIGKRDAEMALMFAETVRVLGLSKACDALVRELYDFAGWWMEEGEVTDLMTEANDLADRLVYGG